MIVGHLLDTVHLMICADVQNGKMAVISVIGKMAAPSFDIEAFLLRVGAR